MKKKWIKPLTLAIAFVGALILFSIITNKTNEDLTTTMAEASLPTMCFYTDGIQVNELHGYTSEMDCAAIRDSITPIGPDRNLFLEINSYGEKVDGVDYEIRGLDGERLLANGEFSDQDFAKSGNKLRLDFQVQNLLSDNEEYLLLFKVHMLDKDAYYYTRLMQTKDYYVTESLDFAKQFHDYTFRNDAASFIPTYMDPATGDATTLNYVDLSCTLKQITWADFECSVLYDPVISIREISSAYNVITIDYVVVHTNEAQEVEYYNVREYYRLKYTTTRMYVLNFERTMNQIFIGENNFVTDKSKIQLGIRDKNVNYMSDENGKVVAFEQEGELWKYSINSNELTRIFGYRSAEGIDARENWNQHKIYICRVDEAGSVEFVVYGYMNRGDHEGRVGIAVYRYDGIAHTVEEEAFIPIERSADLLVAELGKLLYESDLSLLYFELDGTVYQVNLASLQIEPVIENLKDGCYAVSESNRFIAWVEEEKQYSSDSIRVMDMKDGSIFNVTADSGAYICPLDFLQEDLVYGLAEKSNIFANASDQMVFPISRLKILDTAGDDREILKNYDPIGKYISGVSIGDNIIEVQLAYISDGQLLESGMDTIMNRDTEAKSVVTVNSTVTDEKETQIQLNLQKEINSKKTKISTTKYMMKEEPPIVEVKNQRPTNRYYVYAKGEAILTTDNLVKAIDVANDEMGMVVDSNQQYVWKRARATTCSAMKNLVTCEGDKEISDSVAKCVSIILKRNGEDVTVHTLLENGQTPYKVLDKYLKSARVLDLRGCDVDEMLYYVSEGYPVLAMTGSQSAVLIIGYTSSSVIYYSPQATTATTLSMDKAEEMFRRNGNGFIAYTQ